MLIIVATLVVGTYLVFGFANQASLVYVARQEEPSLVAQVPPKPKVLHIKTPTPVRGLYLTSWVAGYKNAEGDYSWRKKIVAIATTTEINTLVIDIKDYTGRISFELPGTIYSEMGADSKRIPDVKEFIQELHDENIYVVGRLSVFQDQFLTAERPELAVLRKDNGEVWRDRMGIAWLDPGNRQVWDYVVGIAQASYALGFDEINFDYIRFPSDGNMQNTLYPHSDPTLAKRDQLNLFFAYLDGKLRTEGIPISADIFGMTTTNTDDLGIGQVLENALAHFDYVAPMVYPSHYPPNFNGWPDPNKVPYELIHFVMSSAVERAIMASSTPSKLRPWLQDFNYGGIYGETEVRAQKQAVYDVGLDSWMLWDPSVKYTISALDLVI